MFLKSNGEYAYETNIITKNDAIFARSYKRDILDAKKEMRNEIKQNYLAESKCKKLKVDLSKLKKKVYKGKNYYLTVDVMKYM